MSTHWSSHNDPNSPPPQADAPHLQQPGHPPDRATEGSSPPGQPPAGADPSPAGPRDIPHCATPTAHLLGPARLSARAGVLLYTAHDGTRLRLDRHRLRQVSLYGSVSVSPDALAALVEHGAHVVWLSPNGLRLRARVTPAADSALLLRLGQYQLYVEPLRRLRLAVSIVQQRIATLGALLRHWQRHAHPDAGALRQQLLDLHRNAQRCRSLDKLRGLEGLATARFFDAFAARLQPPWTFPGRRRRPPTDPVNALLSLTAMLLVRRALTRLQAEGLEPALGILHQFHPGRPSLACDVVEPLRAVFVEQFTLQACNQRWVAPHDFLPADPQLGVRLNHTAFPRLLARWEQYYLENSGPQRLGRIVSQIVRQLRGIRLPAPFNSVQPHQPEEPAPRSSDARSAADASDTQTSSTDTT